MKPPIAPLSAIQSADVDYILPAAEIANLMVRLARHEEVPALSEKEVQMGNEIEDEAKHAKDDRDDGIDGELLHVAWIG